MQGLSGVLSFLSPSEMQADLCRREKPPKQHQVPHTVNECPKFNGSLAADVMLDPRNRAVEPQAPDGTLTTPTCMSNRDPEVGYQSVHFGDGFRFQQATKQFSMDKEFQYVPESSLASTKHDRNKDNHDHFETAALSYHEVLANFQSAIVPTNCSQSDSDNTNHFIKISGQIEDLKKTIQSNMPAPEPSVIAVDSKESSDIAFDRKRLKERLQAAALDDSSQRKQKWFEYFLGIRPANVRLGLEGSRIIHPSSPFMIGYILLSGLVLLYTAAVVPVQQFMWSNDDPCIKFPTLEFDVAVDFFFISEVIVQFFVGYYNDDGKYVDLLHLVAFNYLSSPLRFWFDAVTSIPFSFIDYRAYRDCVRGITHGQQADTKTIRLVKILRFVRLARVMRFFKFLNKFHDLIVIYVGPAIFKVQIFNPIRIFQDRRLMT
mmetsp:Transcript_37941/g.100971  ORF Transcript_37941/g.100971 Transcript_37941/m.100971 type:complete len:431 (+) Transcript_37941:34-1326(+)